MAGLEKQREQYAHAVEALSDPERTRLVLVTRLQKSTLQEVGRTHDELSAIGLKNQYLVINGVLPASEAERDALAAVIWQREQEALANLPTGLSDLPTDNLYLQPLNMVGVPAGLAPIFPDTFYRLTHYWFAAADIPVANDIPVHCADAIRCNVRRPPQGSLPLLTRQVLA